MARSFASTNFLNAASLAAYDGAVGTVAGWFNTSQTSSTNPFLMGRADSASHFGIVMFMDSGTNGLRCTLANSGGNINTLTSGANLNDGLWHPYVLVFDQTSGATCTLYTDGLTAAPGANSLAWTFNSSAIRWGVSLDAFWGPWLGQQDAPVWWSQQLSAAEIVQHARGKPWQTIRPGAIVGAWDMASLVDYSGNGNNLTLSGTGIVPGPQVRMQRALDRGEIDSLIYTKRGRFNQIGRMRNIVGLPPAGGGVAPHLISW